nr:hypothetical protein [Sphingomonas sp. CDS-1]
MLLRIEVRARPPQDSPPRDILIAYVTSDSGYFMSGTSGQALLSLMERSVVDVEVRDAVWEHLDTDAEGLRVQFRRLYSGDGDRHSAIAFAIDSLYGSIIYHIAFCRKILTEKQIELLVDRAIAILNM